MGQAAVGKREAALATLVELDPRGKLGRCDATIRPLMIALVDPPPILPAEACGHALDIAERLADGTLRVLVGRRCQ